MTEDQPFALDVTLRSPMLTGRFYPTLDALLSWVRFIETHDLNRIQDLPLSRTQGVFHASLPMFHRRPLYLNHSMIKRISDEEVNMPGIDWGRSSICTSNKSTGTPNVMDARAAIYTLDDNGQYSGTCLTYFGRGDMQQCADMLSLLPGIGKRAHIGCGEIEHIDPRELDDDVSLHDLRMAPMRPIPQSVWRRIGGSDNVRFDEQAWQPGYRYTEPDLCAVPTLPFLIKEAVNVDPE